jgi:hypothetical protein
MARTLKQSISNLCNLLLEYVISQNFNGNPSEIKELKCRLLI